jgi:hypothetical protein
MQQVDTMTEAAELLVVADLCRREAEGIEAKGRQQSDALGRQFYGDWARDWRQRAARAARRAAWALGKGA